MTNRLALVFAATATSAWLLDPNVARAQQVDTNPPLPNVLILLDNSGSMERMIDGTLPEGNVANTCNCDPTTGSCNWAQTPQPNRWNVVQQALTGALQNGFNCVAMPRTPNSVFTSEYQIGGISPYDTNYYLPFHRMVAQDNSSSPSVPCVVAPGGLPGAVTPAGVGVAGLGTGGKATDFTGGIVTRPYNQFAALPNSCHFTQLSNGAIGTMTDLMRFGLMTFDQDPSAATGVNTPLYTVASPAFTGMWSYFPGWNTGGTCPYLGNPAGCSTQTTLAVGARNPAAPPWEGRMVGFPSTNAISDQESSNGQIGNVILASRPYGATPMDGMLYGAQYYFQSDPTGPQQTDTYVQGGCRAEYMILLTDGAPNDDMRPGCQSGDAGTGVCPFPKLPEDVVASLYNNGQQVGYQQFVKTYVIGFAVSTFQDQGQAANCSSFVDNGGTIASRCSAGAANSSPALLACCELQKIAYNGGTTQAYFADTSGDLQKALGAILADISKQATTRTTPAYSQVQTSAASANAGALQTSTATFLASFNPSPGLPWSGDVQRQRQACSFQSSTSTFTVPTPAVTPSLGDDFAANLNSGSSARTFLALEPGPWNGSSVADSTQTIRPFAASAGDNIAQYSATAVAGQAAAVIPQVTPDALGIPQTGAKPGCQYTPTNGPGPAYLTPTQCRDMLLDFTLGQSFVGPSNFTFVSRTTNAFGDVFHASPVVVGPPGSLLRDPSYDAFRTAWNAVPASSGRGTATGATKPRDNMVYVATNDGLLHAFWADETKLENNEEWALIPPAVMPNLLSSYPSSHQFLLDGTPVVKDVVWERSSGNLFTTGTNPWHTMLVAGFGPYQAGYYAVDVTNPDASGLATGSSSLTPAGPQFRWQLTKMPATNYPIFGGQSAIPAITTLYMDPGDGKGTREIGVVVLPGGSDAGGPYSSAAGGPACPRYTPKGADSAPVGAYVARDGVRCWNKNQKWTDVVSGRALTIARIDTGEILQVFARKADVATYPSDTLLAANRVRDTALDSPMTGTPIVYPSDVGAAATKIFVGDADGTIWRFDVSNTDPKQWTGQLYLDLYNKQVDTSTTSWADGQPFQVPMVASLDPAGELVLNTATGSTATFDTSGTNYLYSITEKVQGSPAQPRAFVNWYLGPQSGSASLRPGERVSGPMTVFNGTLYFATYAASSGAQSCSSGSARLWGWDFVQPYDTTCSTTDPLASCNRNLGGVRELQIPPAAPPDYVDPTVTNLSPAGAVIPGVSIQATPACGSISNQASDTYVPGSSHRTVSNITSQTYSLFAQAGAKSAAGSSAATAQVQLPLPTPVSPTVIDSWAAVLE